MKNTNTHGHMCGICKKFIKAGDVDAHFDAHIREGDINCGCNEKENYLTKVKEKKCPKVHVGLERIKQKLAVANCTIKQLQNQAEKQKQTVLELQAKLQKASLTPVDATTVETLNKKICNQRSQITTLLSRIKYLSEPKESKELMEKVFVPEKKEG